MNNRKRKSYYIAKFLLIVVGSCLILLFIIPFFLFGIMNIGNALGILIGNLFLFFGIFFFRIIDKIRCIFGQKWKKIICFIFLGFVTVFFGIVIVAQSLIVSKMTKKQTGADIVIVLGCQVIGTFPSLMQ